MTETIGIDTQRHRAAKFAKHFETASYEMGQAQRFVTDFCEIFGIDHRRLLDFETRVKKSSGKRGRIDAFIPSLLLVEMKSAGEDLDKAYTQATEYFHGLKNEDLPRSVLVSDFQNLHLYNLETHAEPVKIKLADLARKIDYFQFLAGYEQLAIENQQKINEKAAEKMADLHDDIKKTGYDGKDLENYLVRLLFCLFAEDTGLFGENGAFLNYLHNHTKIDGSDLHGALTLLFDTLNAPPKKRAKNLPQHLAKFPYINGALFEGNLSTCYFDEATRNTLIECAQMDWSEISPAIFGSLFQAVMHDEDEQGKAKTQKRREFGAHYTSEQNILKTIKPLFLDDLWEEFSQIQKTHQAKLVAFHQKLARLNFFDPACGCGNFLIVAYRELRLLELEVIKRQCGKKPTDKQIQSLILCDVDQFYGIDIDESAVEIAKVAMWLTDHQVNLKVQELGNYFNRIPLVKKANIVHANALQIDWQSVIKPKECSFIMGNPPFVGSTYQTKEQKQDVAAIFGNIKGGGVLDYVAAWHIKATEYIKQNPKIPVAFVSTNSICQGEQVGILWSYLLAQGVKIRFAYRTFKWSNEGRGVAAVHCIIVSFGLDEPPQRFIFDDDLKIEAKNINPYLIDAPNVFVENRRKPLTANAPEMVYGNKPVDGGHLLLSPEEKADLITKEPKAEKWIRRLLGSQEFINGLERYCLWLVDVSPNELRQMPEVLKRVEAVKNMRLSSVDAQGRKLAERPTQFRDLKNPDAYLLIPSVSSENRRFVPIGYFDKDVIASNLVFMLPNASFYDFGLLCSTFHNAWMRTVCGRLKSDYRYSNTIVYNNFPFPTPTEKQIKTIEEKAQAVLDARAIHETSTLADLYNPLTMPANLVKAHNELDKAVDLAYRFTGKDKSDAVRVAFLFEKYQELVAPLVEVEKVKTKKVKVKNA